MRLVYIAAPLSAPTPEGIAANLAEAKQWVAWAARLGLCPVATWIPLAEGLLVGGVETAELRELAMRCNLETIEAGCDALLACGPRISDGMKAEIAAAERMGYIRVVYTRARDAEAEEAVYELLHEVPA
jgi:hypothetical protein